MKKEKKMATEKREKFLNLAEKRVNNAIKAIKTVGNLSNKKNYDYTEDHAKEMISALEKEVKELRKKFFDNTSDNEGEFKFKTEKK